VLVANNILHLQRPGDGNIPGESRGVGGVR
jgi:hypothetical protein